MKTPIVLIHGLFGTLHLPEILAAIGGTVYAPDLLGYGSFSTVPPETISLVAQAAHLNQWILEQTESPVHIVGHSVGGAVAVVLASRHPERVASLTSVEGNFTLKDAFWSAQIAQMPLSEVEAIIAGYKQDPATWIADTGVEPTAQNVEIAQLWLDYQPATTVQAQARAVVEATSQPTYLETVRSLMASNLPVHLIAGENSRADWDVPDWAISGATTVTEFPKMGHLMMVESPEAFGSQLRATLQ